MTRKVRKDSRVLDLADIKKRHWQERKSINAIAVEIGIDPGNLHKKLVKSGFQIRGRRDAIIIAAKTRKNTCGEANHGWKGGYTTTSRGYVVNNKTKEYRHREIAAAVLGRPLKPSEAVHHINGDKSDNRNCNLLISTKAYHRALENRILLRDGRHKSCKDKARTTL